MRYDESTSQWVHPREVEELCGIGETSRENLPPSLVRLIDGYEAELTRLRGRGAAAIQLLEEARRLHQHDALGERILTWMRHQ